MVIYEESGGDPPQQFWEDLHDAVCDPCATHENIDDALRTWLALVSAGRDQYLQDEADLAQCSQKLLASPIFAAHRAYVLTQIVYSLLQEDEARPLHVIANFLLLAGRSDETVFAAMVDAGCFARLVDLIKSRRDDDRRLHRLLLELMYEMSRIERVRVSDLLHVDDGFIAYLFRMVEDLADEADDPYHYPVIRVLLVLNEQYMVAATTAAVDPQSPVAPLTNRVIKVLSVSGALYRTFGENIILLLNRETETSLQLLILKLLYLLFTTKQTYEYFYTNDLRVLLDVIIRNLLDLPNESTPLRHTYLRVLYPLLAHTQLSQPPHYKRHEVLRVLDSLSGTGSAHFAPADDTTLRLVDRVSNVDWLMLSPPVSPVSPASQPDTAIDTVADATAEASSSSLASRTSTASAGSAVSAGTAISGISSAGTVSTAATSMEPSAEADDNDDDIDDERSRVAKKMLGISLSNGGNDSCISVVDVAAVKEKPGVKTPSRTVGAAEPLAITVDAAKEEEEETEEHEGRYADRERRRPKRTLPAVPKHRHGVLMKSAETGAGTGGAAGTTTTPSAGIKKLPPKAPPPRRAGRLKQAASSANLHQGRDAI